VIASTFLPWIKNGWGSTSLSLFQSAILSHGSVILDGGRLKNSRASLETSQLFRNSFCPGINELFLNTILFQNKSIHNICTSRHQYLCMIRSNSIRVHSKNCRIRSYHSSKRIVYENEGRLVNQPSQMDPVVFLDGTLFGRTQ
jgi:hypothetical protein